MYTHTIQTADGHRIDVSCWASNTLNFSIAIDGDHYTDGSSMISAGDSEETEATHQARQTAEAIAAGRLRRVYNEWRLIEDEEIKRGEALHAALLRTTRDHWQDGGEPETATEGTVWDFDGWNRPRRELSWPGGYTILGGDLYARKEAR